jgi:hypothetical protein
MKLHKSSLLFGASALMLAACGTNEESSENGKTAEEAETEEVADDTVNETETDENDETDTDTPEQEVGDVIEADGGTRKIIARNYNIDEEQENGPFTVTVKNAQLSQFQPSEDMVDFFDGEDLGMVTLQLEVVNNSDETNLIYPDQGTVVTDNGQQIDAELFLSDDLGGEFYGEVTKSGDVFFFFDGQAEEVSNIRYLTNSGTDEDFEPFGEDIEFSIDF